MRGLGYQFFLFPISIKKRPMRAMRNDHVPEHSKADEQEEWESRKQTCASLVINTKFRYKSQKVKKRSDEKKAYLRNRFSFVLPGKSD